MKRYVFAGLTVFLAVLLFTFPARVAYNWFAPDDVRLSGITGSVWNGNAAEGLAAGAYIRDITWKLKPASVFAGQLAFVTSSKPASGALDAEIAISMDGTLTLSNLSGHLPLDLIHVAFQQAGLGGDVTLSFTTLVIRDGLPVSADGNITVANFLIPGLSSVALGSFRAEFQTTTDGITGSIDDVSGVLDVAGVITLAADSSYSLIGEVAARPGAPPSVTRELQYLGSPNDRGLRPFRVEGQL